jgi:hypothetical protein
MRHTVQLVILAAAAMAGCSTLTEYPKRTAEAQAAFLSQDFGRAAELLQAQQEKNRLDALCYRLERATALQAAGRFADSNRVFEEAFGDARDFDSRALVSARDSAAAIGTLLVNEKAAPYRGEAFERVYIHTFSALNYLLLGDKTSARVEARRALNAQTQEKLHHEEEYAEARRQAAQFGAFADAALNTVKTEYPANPAVEQANVFLDAFSFYVATVIYEVQGEYANAADLARTDLLRLLPASRTAQEQYVRCLRKDGKPAPKEMKSPPDVRLPGKEQGEVIVFLLCGLSPKKEEVKIVLPIPTGGGGVAYAAMAFPKYEARENPVVCARASVGAQDLGRTEALSDVERKAFTSLSERLPVLAVKAFLRAAIRYGVQYGIQAAESEDEDEKVMRRITSGLVGLAGVLAEQADLRSWLTLPRSLQVARGVADGGKQEIRIELLGPANEVKTTVTQPVEVAAGRLTVVVVRTVGPNAVAFARTL